MTAMGIIGIILASVVGIILVVGMIAACLEEKAKDKQKMVCEIIGFAIDAYSEETRKLLNGVMEDTMKKIPDMAKGMYKTFEIEEEP